MTRIQSLENELGAPLLIRAKGHHSVELTGYGQAFIPIASQWTSLWKYTQTIKAAEDTSILTIASIDSVNNYTLEHYDLPLIFTGGVVRKPCKVETLCSQADITATLLGLLGIGHEEFPWSKDIFDCGAPHYAVFAVPDAVGMVREEGAIIWDNSFQRVMLSTYPQGQEDKPLMTLKAYYQELYKTADEL